MTTYEIHFELNDYRTETKTMKEALYELWRYTKLNIYKHNDIYWGVVPDNNCLWNNQTKLFKTRKECLEYVKEQTGYEIVKMENWNY